MVGGLSKSFRLLSLIYPLKYNTCFIYGKKGTPKTYKLLLLLYKLELEVLNINFCIKTLSSNFYYIESIIIIFKRSHTYKPEVLYICVWKFSTLDFYYTTSFCLFKISKCLMGLEGTTKRNQTSPQVEWRNIMFLCHILQVSLKLRYERKILLIISITCWSFIVKSISREVVTK